MQRTIAVLLHLSIMISAMIGLSISAGAQTHYRFAHDQQLNSGYSVAYDIFSAKLKQLSNGQMVVDQYPGAQLGQEPQLLQLVKSGDLASCHCISCFAGQTTWSRRLPIRRSTKPSAT